MTETNANNSNIISDEINFAEVFNALWKRKYLIISTTFVAAILSVYISLSIPNTYTSGALLSPANEDNSSKLGAYSSLAGMAGISLPGDKINPSQEAIERIKSYDFFTNHFLPYISLQNLFAIDRWDAKTNKIIYDEDIFDPVKNKWVREVSFPKRIIPSNQEAYERYREIMSISEDRKTSFVSITINHKSAFVAKEWLDIIIKNINESMREEDKLIAQNAIDFLNKTSKETNIKEIQDSIARLLEGQMQDLMLASVSTNYIYKVINSPLSPEKKTSPSRALICILGTFLGGIIGVFLSFIQNYRDKRAIKI